MPARHISPILLLLGTSACFRTVGVVSDGPTPGVCADIACSGHGRCAVLDDNTAACVCDDGYTASGSECVALGDSDDDGDSDSPCPSNFCQDHGYTTGSYCSDSSLVYCTADTAGCGSVAGTQACSLGCASSSCVVAPNAPTLRFWFERSTVKVRQDATVKTQPTIQIKSAKNEFEPFQLVIATDQAVDELDVEISDFVGPSGAVIPSTNVTIMLEKYLNVTTASTVDAKTGEWPDMLCPKIDAYYHEKRNFFPFSIAAGRLQPIWFDLFVPDTAAAGDYEASVSVTRGGAIVYSATVRMKVWDFALPGTSSYAAKFGINYNSVHLGHYGNLWGTGMPGSAEIVALQRLYMRANLRHRINPTPGPMYFGQWNGTDYASFDASGFSQSLAGFMQSGVEGVEYSGARITRLSGGFTHYTPYLEPFCNDPSMTTPPPGMLDEARKRVQRIASVLTPEMKEIYYLLPLDEPGGGETSCGGANPALDYNSAIAMGQIARAAALKTRITKRRVPELLNTSVDPPRNDYWDVWVAPFHRIDGRAYDNTEVNTRSEYDADLAAGAQLEWYQGCNTHGCGEVLVGGHEYDGYPQYMVDYPAMRNRIFPWLAFKYGVTGEVYWGTVANYEIGADASTGSDPWFTLWNKYHGNGEGTLYYPGVPDPSAVGFPHTSNGKTRGAHTPAIGGSTRIPIESFRLKMIREGIEDHDYLAMLSDLGDEAFALAQVNSVVTNTFTFSEDPDAYDVIREAVAERILELLGK